MSKVRGSPPVKTTLARVRTQSGISIKGHQVVKCDDSLVGNFQQSTEESVVFALEVLLLVMCQEDHLRACIEINLSCRKPNPVTWKFL